MICKYCLKEMSKEKTNFQPNICISCFRKWYENESLD